MDFIDTVNKIVKDQRRERFNNSDQLSLGKLIEKLEEIVNNKKLEGKKLEEINIYYDFEYLFPLQFDSWRGSYDELCLDINMTDNDLLKPKDPLNILDFISLCKNTIGKEFYGYKGGDYIMDENTPIWVANYSHSGNTALIDVLDYGFEVILITEWKEY